MAYQDYIKDFLPDVSLTSAVPVITIVILFIVGAIIFGIIIYFLLMRMKFNKKIIIFEKVGKDIQPTRKDKAMVLAIGQAGDSVFYTRKFKKYLPSPIIQTGKNVYWFYIREDGEWINIGIEDIDAKMREMKAHFLDKEMRYARVGLQKNLKDRYQKESFWAKYGGLIAYIGLIAIVGIMVWLLFDKFIEISNSVANAVKSAGDVVEETKKLVGALDNLKASGGLQPA